MTLVVGEQRPIYPRYWTPHLAFKGTVRAFPHASEQPRFQGNNLDHLPITMQSTMISLGRRLKLYPDNKILADATAKSGKMIVLKSLMIAIGRFVQALFQGEDPIKAFVKGFIDTRFILGESPEQFRPRIPITLPSVELISDNPRYQEMFQAMHQSWPKLVRQTPDITTNSLIPLPNPYVIAGGRFNEMYYWDSYFILLGLRVSGLSDLAKGMVDNLLHLSNQYGIIPNGNRLYYLSRSQPPFITAMIKLIAPAVKDKGWLEKAYLTAKKEYSHVWMNPKTHFVPEYGLNRYFDPVAEPRIECVPNFYDNKPNTKDYYRHNRAECESGWDFTRRFDNRCSDFLPVDLNSILYRYEMDMADLARDLNREKDVAFWEKQAQRRREKINQYLWDEQSGLFVDFDMKKNSKSHYASLASFYPLWAGLTTEKQAGQLIEQLTPFIAPGGLKTSLYETGEQWDGSNGWPALQWIVIKGVQNYQPELARALAKRWLDVNYDVFKQSATIFEKYNVSSRNTQTQGHYPSQGTFGWGMGVNMALLTDILGYPVSIKPAVSAA